MRVTRTEILNRAEAILAECRTLVPSKVDTLNRVRFRVSGRMTRAAGKARPVTAKIDLSLPFFADRNNFDTRFRETVTHEIAHILAPPVRHAWSRKRDIHGLEWQAMHRALGGKGERCHDMDLAVGYAARREARRVQVPCGKCGQPISLGPTQARRHAASVATGGRGYFHKACPR